MLSLIRDRLSVVEPQCDEVMLYAWSLLWNVTGLYHHHSSLTSLLLNQLYHIFSVSHAVLLLGGHIMHCTVSLQPTSEIVGRRCLRSADTTTLQVPSTRRATLGDRTFPVAAARAWNSLPLETRACSSLLTFRRETKSHLFRQLYS